MCECELLIRETRNTKSVKSKKVVGGEKGEVNENDSKMLVNRRTKSRWDLKGDAVMLGRQRNEVKKRRDRDSISLGFPGAKMI